MDHVFLQWWGSAWWPWQRSDPSVQVAPYVPGESLWDVLCAPRLGQVGLQLLSTS